MHVELPTTGEWRQFPTKALAIDPAGSMGYHLRVAFELDSRQRKYDVVSLVHGDSGRWMSYQNKRQKGLGVSRAFIFLLVLGTKSVFMTSRALFADALKRVIAPIASKLVRSNAD